jgi:3-deoxy-D-arabino-heptulosonate 7-phosphate (DAHP) synthase
VQFFVSATEAAAAAKKPILFQRNAIQSAKEAKEYKKYIVKNGNGRKKVDD